MNKVIYVQLHCHSRISVNRLSGEGVFHRYIWPLERFVTKALMKSQRSLLEYAISKGVDFIAISDHNMLTTDWSNERIIPSEERGQKKGHANFIGISRSIDPDDSFFKGKDPVSRKNFKEAFDEAHRQGLSYRSIIRSKKMHGNGGKSPTGTQILLRCGTGLGAQRTKRHSSSGNPSLKRDLKYLGMPAAIFT